ncbi:dihydrofolate reductase family protein [uncultured Clostridium sp.]|uniref:dihydrofolate reductase family protein n=1 Tax=uncultured Clostridium sp. TaxID=59620 RepID=UPI0025E99FB1|nr:dihydrofolate reductase family protein [uncultured Clostridium sp.]
MKKVVLFIAMSLDGYIADGNGGVDWLKGQVSGADDMASYYEFIKDIDTVIMGANTYNQLVTELSPDEWMYHGLTSYIITHHWKEPTDEIIFTGQNPVELVKQLRQNPGKGIWICGGADIARQLISNDLIDRYYISVIPTILGKGIRLFSETKNEIELKLAGTKSYNGIVDLIYEHR